MFYIVVDEAGISEHEPVAVVTGVVLHDSNIVFVGDALREAIGAVPAEYRENFHFHATRIWNEKEYKNWLMSDRLKLICDVLSIARKVGAPVAAGFCVRAHEAVPLTSDSLRTTKIM